MFHVEHKKEDGGLPSLFLSFENVPRGTSYQLPIETVLNSGDMPAHFGKQIEAVEENLFP